MNSPTEHPSDEAAPDAWLSDLADGQLDPDQLPARCADWARDARYRSTWHAYQLIGDVLRSDDLASSAAHDAEFLNRLRTRLASEPVVLAPGASPPRRARRQVWLWPVAAAAGFVAVAGVLVVLQQLAPGDEAGARIANVEPAPAVTTPIRVSTPIESTEIIRNARVDEYLRLHRDTLAGAPVALPGGAMRSVDLSVPSR